MNVTACVDVKGVFLKDDEASGKLLMGKRLVG
jgi:hypothetical protein